MKIDKFARSISSLTDTNRAIRLRIATASGVRDDLLFVKYVSGVESMFGGIEYTLQCLSLYAGIELKNFIANPVELQFVTDSGGLMELCPVWGQVQHINGCVVAWTPHSIVCPPILVQMFSGLTDRTLLQFLQVLKEHWSCFPVDTTVCSGSNLWRATMS